MKDHLIILLLPVKAEDVDSIRNLFKLFRLGFNSSDKSKNAMLTELLKLHQAEAIPENFAPLAGLNLQRAAIAKDGHCCKNSLIHLFPGLTPKDLRVMEKICETNHFHLDSKAVILKAFDKGDWAGINGDIMCQLQLLAANLYGTQNGHGPLIVYNSRTGNFSAIGGANIPADQVPANAKVIIYNGINHYDATDAAAAAE